MRYVWRLFAFWGVSNSRMQAGNCFEGLGGLGVWINK
jgi:hypothetical protein